MKTKVLLITGSPDWTNYNAVARQLAIAFGDAKKEGYEKVIVRHADRKAGVDAMAKEFTNKVERSVDGLKIEQDPKPIHNKEMVNLGADLCLVFVQNYSPGSAGCARLAKEAGIETVYFRS